MSHHQGCESSSLKLGFSFCLKPPKCVFSCVFRQLFCVFTPVFNCFSTFFAIFLCFDGRSLSHPCIIYYRVDLNGPFYCSPSTQPSSSNGFHTPNTFDYPTDGGGHHHRSNGRSRTSPLPPSRTPTPSKFDNFMDELGLSTGKWEKRLLV